MEEEKMGNWSDFLIGHLLAIEPKKFWGQAGPIMRALHPGEFHLLLTKIKNRGDLLRQQDPMANNPYYDLLHRLQANTPPGLEAGMSAALPKAG